MEPQTKKMPVVFVGHGSPMNGIEDNQFARGWREISYSLPKPTAILSISAHWETQGMAITAMETPRTIHDFGGFPQELYNIQYAAKGNPELAKKIQDLLGNQNVRLNVNWGLDHGTWIPLIQFYPDASIPVLQLSLNRNFTFQEHYAIASKLASLRNEGVLIFGTGNVVHSFEYLNMNEYAKPRDWAIQFNSYIKENLLNHTHHKLIDTREIQDAALKSINTAEHYIPLLYISALIQSDEKITFYNDEIWATSMSMLCIVSRE